MMIASGFEGAWGLMHESKEELKMYSRSAGYDRRQ
jgi:hypothetical protein